MTCDPELFHPSPKDQPRDRQPHEQSARVVRSDSTVSPSPSDTPGAQGIWGGLTQARTRRRIDTAESDNGVTAA